MIQIIQTTKQLNSICSQIYNTISVDTEFIRDKTYFPTLCLIQISFIDKQNNINEAIIDVLSNKIKIKRFFAILKDKNIKKIFHSINQDYDALKSLNKKLEINNFEDTQLMLEFCNLGYNVGYETAVNNCLHQNFTKDKKIQTSNWFKRPLTQKQINYSINDVRYLKDLYDILYNKLIKNGNYEYYKDELKHLKIRKKNNYLFANAWKKSKIDLNCKKMSFIYGFKKIMYLREKVAIKNNTIRNNIIDDRDIEQLLLLNNKSFKNKIKNNMFLFGYYNKIIDIVEKTKNSKNKKIFYNREHNFVKQLQLQKLYKNIIDLANKQNIDINTLITKSDIIALLQKYQSKNTILYGWKYKILGKIFKDI